MRDSCKGWLQFVNVIAKSRQAWHTGSTCQRDAATSSCWSLLRNGHGSSQVRCIRNVGWYVAQWVAPADWRNGRCLLKTPKTNCKDGRRGWTGENGMRWRWWRVKRRVRTVIVLAIVTGAVAWMLPSTGREADVIRRPLGPLVEAVRPPLERALDWLDRQAYALRDRFSTIGNGSRTPRQEEPVRIFRGSTLSGPARAIDGDTLDMRGVHVRLHGIDAPEDGQSCWSGGHHWPCGREATQALASQIDSQPVVCEEHDRDSYGRVVATCSLAGRDLNAWIVAQGWALAYRPYSLVYVAEESRARAAKRGVWRGEVVAPWEWRKGKRLGDARQAENAVRPAAERIADRHYRKTQALPERFGAIEDGHRSAVPKDEQPVRIFRGGRAQVLSGSARVVDGEPGCRIKGNISKSGKRIYHVPGGRYYDQTGVNTSKGERWFCTEGEARAAGWRRSRR